MSRELDKVKTNKIAIIKAVRNVADEMFKLDELLEDIGCNATPEEWNAIFKNWMDKGYPLHDDVGEIAWQLVDYADELEELMLDEDYEERKKSNAEAIASMF